MKTSRSRLMFIVILAGFLGVLSTAGAAPGPPARGRPKVRVSFQADTEHIDSLAFSCNGKKLLSLGFDGLAKIWEVSTGKNLATLKGNFNPAKGRLGTISVAALSPDGKMIASAEWDRSIRLWDVATGKKLDTLEQPEGGVPAFLLFGPDGKSLLSLGRTNYLWDLEKKKERIVMDGLSERLVRAVAFDPMGTPYVIACSNGSNVSSFQLWTTDRDQKATVTFDVPIDNSRSYWSQNFAFSPDCKTIASANGDGCIRLWDAATGKITATLNNLPGLPFGLPFSPDGKLLAAGYKYPQKRDALPGDPVRRYLCIHEVATGKVLAKLEGDPSLMLPFVFSPDGRTLATGDGGSKITLWSLPARYAPPK